MPRALVAAALTLFVCCGEARATCRSVELTFQPVDRLQIAAWVEDDAGNFIDTVYVTRATGALGLANRPGNARFKSSYRWPYGRRVMVLPVWAHRRNHSYGYVVMGGQMGVDPDDNSIGYHESYSSAEQFYCPPSSLALDATSCASAFMGSKGVYASGQMSLYPPRGDLSEFGPNDSDDARKFADDNDLQIISGATPPGGQLLQPSLEWIKSNDLPDGRYHFFVEASLEADFNAANQHPSFPDFNSELRGIGRDVLGQPSIVYEVDVLVDGTARTASSDDYAGYGMWDGSTGDLFPPDDTISDAPGTGAGRLAHITDGNGTWRLKVDTLECNCSPPPAPGPVMATPADTSIALSFAAPAVSGARSYQIRYRPNTALDDGNFSDGIPADMPPMPKPGGTQSATLTGLKGQTLYYVGVRTLNACGDPSPGQFASTTTRRQKFVTLSGCFIATAAFGSPMEPDVALLRRFRDRALLPNPLGELAVAVYYSASPPLAAAISTDERLRALARRLLRPAVALARVWLLNEDSRP
jgi:hypothetical protein